MSPLFFFPFWGSKKIKKTFLKIGGGRRASGTFSGPHGYLFWHAKKAGNQTENGFPFLGFLECYLFFA